MTHFKEIVETPSDWVLEDMTKAQCSARHESLLYSFRVLDHVKTMLGRKDSPETILETISILNTMQQMVNPKPYVVKNK